MKHSIILLIACLVAVYCDSQYIIGKQGQSCNQACFGLGLNCNPHIVTNDSKDVFTELGIKCNDDEEVWDAQDQPSYVSASGDPNFGKCLGYKSVPAATHCSGSLETVQRLCRCDKPTKTQSSFGTGYSNGQITTEEKWMFTHVLATGDVGALTHFWTTYATAVDDGVMIRYYIDGEKTASIQFTPSLACGVGFYDQQGPWATEWFGKGALNGGWFNNFRVPFQKSIVVTAQHLYANNSGFYLIIRGATNVAINVGGTVLPKTAKLNQFVTDKLFQVLDYVPLVNITSGSGVHWMSTISAGSKTIHFLEGCVHAYTNGEPFPGVILGTGSEDYFDSAWFFDGGQFHLPVSGFTHFNQTTDYLTWSAYRFHDVDPLFFDNGFQLVWRIGDALDAANTKCLMQTGGTVAGKPSEAQVLAYAWTYTW